MITNLELYGTEDVPKIPAGICNERIALLEDNLDNCIQKPLGEQSSYKEVVIIKAIKFWKSMRDGEDIEL